MNTVQAPRPAGNPPAVSDCVLCGRPVITPDGKPTTCSGCRDEFTRANAAALLHDVTALAEGRVPFDGLTPDERREQLDALGVVLDSLAQPKLRGLDRGIAKSLRGWSYAELANYIGKYEAGTGGYEATVVLLAGAEIVRRLDGLA